MKRIIERTVSHEENVSTSYIGFIVPSNPNHVGGLDNVRTIRGMHFGSYNDRHWTLTCIWWEDED